MIWKKEKEKEESVTVKLNGQTLHFKPDTEREITNEGITVRFYEHSFQEKQQPNIKKVEKKKSEPEKTTKFTQSSSLNGQTKQETIEKMFEMSVDDLALKLNALQSERENNRKNIQTYAKSEEEMKYFLEQLIKKELYLNKEVAEPILMKYEVHPENKHYQTNLSKPKEMVEALFYIQHCHRADIVDMLEEVRKAKQENRSLGMNLEEMQEKQNQMKEERQQEQEKVQKVLADFKEKYAALQEELKAKIVEVQQAKQEQDVLQKQLTTMEKAVQVAEAERNKAVETALEEPLEEIVDAVYEEMVEKAEVEEVMIPDDAFIEETPSPEEEKEDGMLTLPNFDLDFMDDTNETVALQEEMPYVSLLKEKGYEVEPAVSHEYDWMVAKDTGEKIPLMYIYYDIEKADEFDTMMKETDKMYFVFDSKKRMFKGNTKFTSWLLKQKERKYNIQFSFTTMDQLKTSGLSMLDKM